MTVSPTLMQAILAMDSYNQGYGKGIDHGIKTGLLKLIIQHDFA